MKKLVILLLCLMLLSCLAGCQEVQDILFLLTQSSADPSAPRPTTAQPTTAAPSGTGHIHEYAAAVTEPTCTETGYTTYTCACGDSYTDSETAALEHSYTVEVEGSGSLPTCTRPGKLADIRCERCEAVLPGGEIPALEHEQVPHAAKEPDCTEPGWDDYVTCANCDYSTYAERSALGHDYSILLEETAKAPACTEPGREADTKCSRCDSVETGKQIPATGHSYEAVITAATCTENGCTTHTCHCGDSYTDTEVPALGHSWGDWATTLEPTEQTEGIAERVCAACAEAETKPIPTLAHVHAYSAVVTAPTCQEPGYTTYICSCGDSYTDSQTPALGHQYEGRIESHPSCTQEGKIVYVCLSCGDQYSVIQPMREHSYVGRLTDPTCTEKGYKTYTCSDCGHSYIVYDEQRPAGHSYRMEIVYSATCIAEGLKRFTCEACGDTYTEALEKIQHSYTETVTAPTCTQNGFTTFACRYCADSYTANTVEATGHSYIEAITRTATCVAEGEKTYTCTCGDSYTQAVAKLEHDYYPTVTRPTCTEKGYTTYTCAMCRNSYQAEERPATGHDYKWAVTTEPDCDSDGVKTFTCKECGDTYTEVLDQTGHRYTSTQIAPTCTEKGCTHYSCTACADAYTADWIPALGHDYSIVLAGTAREASCTEPGKEADECCIRCMDTKPGTQLPATGHSYQAEVVAATCTAGGYTSYTCHCGDSYTAELTSALGHNWGRWVVVRPGELQKRTCTRCDAFEEKEMEAVAAYEPQGLKALLARPNGKTLEAAYRRIAAGVENGEEVISLRDDAYPLLIEDLDRVVECYCNDYPQHFWVGNSYSYSYLGSTVYDIRFAYLMTGQTLADARAAFAQKVEEYMSLISADMSQYEIELKLHDAIINNCKYVNGSYAHTAYGALVEGKAVCEGYAKAFQYLMHLSGMNCIMVSGYSGEAHAWNAIQLGQSWYYVDVTWDDPVPTEGQPDVLRHAYFNLTREMMDEDHAAEEGYIPLPEATELQYFYYQVNCQLVYEFDAAYLAGRFSEGNVVEVYVMGDLMAYIDQFLTNFQQVIIQSGRYDISGIFYTYSGRWLKITAV